MERYLMFISNNLLFFLFIIHLGSVGQTILEDPHWELVLEDQFNDLNTSKWLVEYDWDHYASDRELQVYTNRNSNVFIRDGNLVLKVYKELYHCTSAKCNKEWYDYTSGWVETQPSFYFRYGLIQARICLPYGNGFWPAFWTFLGPAVPGANDAEIDIFEMVGYLPNEIITTNIHTDHGNEPDNYEEYQMGNYSYTYHNYAVAWSPDKIVWYVDGKPFRILNNHGINDLVKIILNFAILADYPPDNNTPFPSEMLIDYVKVYRLRNNCDNSVWNCDFNNVYYLCNYHVMKDIKIGGLNCNNKLNWNTNYYLRASNSFTIEGNFNVPLGSTLFIDVNPCH